MKKERLPTRSKLIVALGVLIGAAIGYYNGFFAWHDLKAVILLAFEGTIISIMIEEAKTDVAAQNNLRNGFIGGLIGASFAIAMISLSVEGKAYLISETINWSIAGIMVGQTVPNQLTLSTKIGFMLGLGLGLLIGWNNSAPQGAVEIGEIHLLVDNPNILFVMDTISCALLGAWFGAIFGTTFLSKKRV